MRVHRAVSTFILNLGALKRIASGQKARVSHHLRRGNHLHCLVPDTHACAEHPLNTKLLEGAAGHIEDAFIDRLLVAEGLTTRTIHI